MNKVARIDEAKSPPVDKVESRPAGRNRLREFARVGSLVVLGVAVLAGLILYLLAGRYESTDNAYVQANKSYLSAQVSGRAVEILARTNQAVKAGDVLFRLDDAPYRIALARAEADVDSMRNDIGAMQASVGEKDAAVGTARANLDYAQKEFDRQKELVARGVVSKVKFDESEHALSVARQKLSEAQQDLAATAAKLGRAQTADLNPQVRHAIAVRDQARLDLEHTVVRAPEDAIVASVDVQLGEQVMPDKPVVSLVSRNSLWITANFKETQLTHVQPGQTATITVDIYPGREWHATVGSLSPATGAEFSLIPPQNASGNWVKVVQRVPVRLYLEDYEGDVPLPAGLSAQVKVDTHHRSGLAQLIHNFFG
ncbi:MAG: HlyD family secretion protein [Sphingomonadales bacterium]